MDHHTSRTVAVVGTAIVALLVWSVLAPLPAGAAGAPGVAGLDCQPGSEGALFVTDSGLEASYDGQSLDSNPFVNDTTLAFPNVTVRASNTASVRVVTATDDGACLRSIDPTSAPVVLAPDAGPTVVVRDSLVNLSYGPFEYARSASGVDLAYNASAPASVTIRDGSLSSGRTVEAVDVDSGSQLVTGTVTASDTVDLSLPAGDYRIDLRYRPVSTPTATPTATQTPTATSTATQTPTPTPAPTATQTPTTTPAPTATQTPTTTAIQTATQTTTTTATPADTPTTPSPTATATPTETRTSTQTQTTTPTPSPTAASDGGTDGDTGGDSQSDADDETSTDSDGSTGGVVTTTTTPTPTVTLTPTLTATAVPPTESRTPTNASGFTVPAWTGELVVYEPSPQTQHVGGLLPLAVSLWALALWLLIARRGPETRALALVLVVASVRATSDLAQIVLDGFVGVEASLASLNLSLEFSTAVLFASFAVQYADLGDTVTRRTKRSLGALGAGGIVAVLTNPVHGLVFTDAAVATGPFTYVTASVGPVGWLLFALTMSLVGSGGLLVGQPFVAGSPRGTWRPIAVIGTGLVIALGIAVLDVLELGPITGYDYSAAGVNYFVLATTVSLLGYGFQRLKPSGQRSIVADLDDAIVILDDTWHVVEWNGAAERLFPDLTSGHSFDAVLPEPLDRPRAGQTITREMSLEVDRPVPGEHRDDEGPADSDPATDGGSDVTPPADDESSEQVPATDSTASTASETETDPMPATTDETDVATELSPDRPEDRHYIVNARTVMTETNDVIGYTVRFADVTALKRHMMRLERKNDQLDQFAGAVTQDLRGPLSEARAETERVIDVLSSADDPTTVDRSRLTTALGSIDDALDRMASLVEDILGLARDDELTADPEPVRFGTTVTAVWDRVGSADATLSIETDGELRADPDHLDRLLAVLLRNAIDHGGDGVTIRVGVTDDGFYVADDGPGIPPSIRDRAFESGVTTADSAAGLGLTMARQRASAHDWSIGVDDDADGARIVVRNCETDRSPGGVE